MLTVVSFLHVVHSFLTIEMNEKIKYLQDPSKAA